MDRKWIVAGMALSSLVASCTTGPEPIPSLPAPVTPAQTAPPSPGEVCRAAVAQTANRPIGDTSVLQTDSSRAGSGVRIGLRGAERPWLCILGPDGSVRNVMYMGEG